MKNFFGSRRRAILIIVLIGLLVRLWAALQLPGDFDEPVYLDAGFEYARMIRSGDLAGVIDYLDHPEHPPLTKLIYALAILPEGRRAGYADALMWGRLVSVIFGTLAVWVLAVIDPVAGALLAIQTYAVKYTSQAYLEALPLFTGMVALAAILNSKRQRDRWFWLSAAALGLTAAGKYSYFPIVIPIIYIYFIDKKYSWKNLLLFALVVMGIFLLFDPALWRDPINRFWNSVTFHAQYSQSAEVELNRFSVWYQPLKWLSRSYPYEWHPGVFFYNPLEGLFSIDGIIFLLALGGLYSQWKGRRWVVIWMAGGVLALLLWPTKWPQYTLVVIPAFCLAASAALAWIANWARGIEDYYGWFSSVIPKPTRFFWVALVFFLILAVVSTAGTAINLGLARRGWTHYIQDLSLIPSNQVNAISAWGDGKMALGTSRGLAIFQQVGTENETAAEEWLIYNLENSDLPDSRILSLEEHPDGSLWIGTRSGLARLDGQNWQIFRAADIGLEGESIHDIAIDPDGNVWIGSDGGAASYDGRSWQVFTVENSGLRNNLVLSVASQSGPGGEVIYFGTGDGLYRFEPSSGEWQSIAPERFNRAQGGVSDLLVDSQDRLWVATLGGGLSMLDGDNWRTYTISNSDLPTNRVDVIKELFPGQYWIGTSFPERPGGFVSRFDGQKWQTYRGLYSGYSGASLADTALDDNGRIWFGTLTSGVDTYLPPQ